jgi:aspartate/methionine/tyrosine aminotransferase
MKINVSKATFSSIVGIGQKVKKAAKESNEVYLELNRGVNAVTEIDLSKVMNKIDFNSKEFQVYAPNLGLESLRKEIVKEYFPSFETTKGFENNIAITPGGMPALDLVIQLLNVENIYFPKFYWGSYSKMATIRQKPFSFYSDLKEFDLSKLNDSSCIFICDPSNPTGLKLDDNELYDLMEKINNTGAIIIYDCPYRKLFYEDDFFNRISHFENVIITESFSKWIGLSGLRLGFIFSNNKDFNAELNIRLLYEFNAVSSPSQMIIEKVISTPEGRLAHNVFRKTTVENITKNINYLKENNLLVTEIYGDSKPMGIFAVINKSEDFLFQNKIGAVGLDKFVYYDKDTWSSYSRICVSVQHELFKSFISKIV